MTPTASPLPDVLEPLGARRCLPVDKPALAADKREAVLSLRFVFAQQRVEDAVVPVGLGEGGCGRGGKLLR
jgi:hypothetical protein